MGNCVMVVLSFWRKHEVGYVAVSTVTDFFTVLFSYSSGLMLIFFYVPDAIFPTADGVLSFPKL
jgi:hypothetical protein